LEKFAATPAPDVIFYDPFSAKTDSALWVPEVFARVRAHCGEKAAELFTYSSATAVRVALLSASNFGTVDDASARKMRDAAAGLERLGLADRIHERIDPSISLHAVGQGALGIECRQGDATVLGQIKVLEHLPTARRCLAERAFLRELEGGCQVPIGVNTRFEGDALVLTGMVASLDGQRLIRDETRGDQADPEAIGVDLAQSLKAQGAGTILEQIFATVRPEA
jgi:hypothetical protein